MEEKKQITIEEIAKFLIKKSDENADREEYEMAVKLIGRKSAVLVKVEEQIELTPEDIEYIKNNLQ